MDYIPKTVKGEGGWRGEWARDKVIKRRRGKERVEWGRGRWSRRAVLAFLPRGPEFQVTPLHPPSPFITTHRPYFLGLWRCSIQKHWKSTFSITPLSFDASSVWNPREYPHKPYMLRETSVTGLHIRRQIFMVVPENACILKRSA